MAVCRDLDNSFPRRFLAVDDEKPICRFIQVNLERAGHLVVCAFDGRQAIEALQRETFDGVFLDVMMPYVDGFEVLRWIRENEGRRHVWVGLMSAQATEIEADSSFAYRADAYIKKPFNPREFWP